MLSVQISAGGFQEKTDEELEHDADEVDVILEQADAEKQEKLQAAGITEKDLKRNSIYRPLTTSNWMFDAVSDLTKPTTSSPAANAPPQLTPLKIPHRNSRFIPLEAFSDAPATPVSATRRQSTHFDLPTLAPPPPIHSLGRRYSLQFTPSSPTATHSSFFSSTVVGEEDEDEKALSHRVLHPSRSTTSIVTPVPRRERIKWDKGRIVDLAEVKIDEKEKTAAEESIPSQPSFYRLMRDVWPTMTLKPLIIFGVIVSIASGAMTPIFSFVLSRLQYEVSIGATDHSAINVFGGISLAVAAADGLLIGLKYFVMEYAAMDWVNSIRKTCFRLILAQDKKWFDKTENGPVRLVQILIKDGDDSRSLIATVLAQTLVVTAMLGLGLIWALVQGWQLTLVGFALAPVFAITMAVQTNLVAKCEYRNKRAREEVAKGYYDVCHSPLPWYDALMTLSFIGYLERS